MSKIKIINDRCPLQGECGRKQCEYKLHERDCSYYQGNARPGAEIEDQQQAMEAEWEARMSAPSVLDGTPTEPEIPDRDPVVVQSNTSLLVLLPVTRLHPHPDNPRKDVGDVQELADSIKANGILQNLTVVPDDPTSSYTNFTVIIGHRRLAAAKLAGLTEVPCVVTMMTAKEQVQTMLLENMQRTDLTVYEQAQGFQMMLDLGGTIQTIAQDTGFSETTVRRRVKLLELDPKEFKKSEARGATLFDYMELDKVDDPKEKNRLLKAIGTSDFHAKLQKVLDGQKKVARKAHIEERLSSFAAKVEGYPGTDYAYVSGPDYWSDSPIEAPKDAGAREYVFTLESYGAKLYRKKDKDDIDAEAQREAEYKEKSDRHKARVAEFKEASDRALKLRRDFVMSLSSTACKKLVPTAVASLLVSAAYYGSLHFDDDDLELLGIPANEDGEQPFENVIEQITASMGKTDKAIVRLAYLCMEPSNGYYSTWYIDSGHTENEVLDKCYEFLAMLGYEMSEEEKALQDGTHEVFKRKEG